MLELCIDGRQIMTVDDNNKTTIFDKNIANNVDCDINGKKIEFELCDNFEN